MSSSDSDDFYGNIAQKLQSLRSQYVEEKLPSVDSSLDIRNNEPIPKTDTIAIDVEACNTTLNSSTNDEWSLDAIIAKHTTSKRGRKRKTADVCVEPAHTGRTRRKTANSNKADKSIIVIDENPAGDTGAAKRGKRGRVKKGGNTARNASPRGRRGSSTNARTLRGRGRGRTARNSSRGSEQVNMYPTYSVGNTDEYEDMCDDQELFSTNPSNTNDIQVIEEEDPLANDNEELSVKVYWQSLEVVRFKIRKYQKLKPLFQYFSSRENVAFDKLVFMYNDRIVKVDDTPDAIDYSIVKFIDGGIVEHDVTGLMKQNSKELKGGLKIKFQCQNLKKPFETTIKPDDNLALAMMKCSEHLETALDRLKFFFDGDLISSKTTAKELDLEGGECIDVKIVS